MQYYGSLGGPQRPVITDPIIGNLNATDDYRLSCTIIGYRVVLCYHAVLYTLTLVFQTIMAALQIIM